MAGTRLASESGLVDSARQEGGRTWYVEMPLATGGSSEDADARPSLLFHALLLNEEGRRAGARSRESLSTGVLKTWLGKSSQAPVPEPGSLGRLRAGKVTSSKARSQHLSVWSGERRVPVGWSDWPQIIAFHFHIPPMAHAENSFHAS